MDKLPVEIFQRIFFFYGACCERLEGLYYNHSYTVGLELLVLSHVCRKWRIIALSYGELWTYLDINLHYKRMGNAKPDKLKEIYDTWLERTRASPLNFRIWIGARFFYHQTTEQVCEHMIVSLLSQCWRWKDVDFKWRHISFSDNFPGITMTNMPMLRSLTLEEDKEDRRPRPIRLDISHSPQLRCLTLCNIIDVEVGNATVYQSLEKVYVDCKDVGRPVITITDMYWCRKLLEFAPNLVHLYARFEDISITGGFPAVFQSAPANIAGEAALGQARDKSHFVLLQSLRTLRLYRGSNAAYMLEPLTLPSLQALEYAYDGCNRGAEVLLAFVKRSLPPLTWLELWGNSTDETFLLDVLRLLPFLEMLGLMGVKITPRFFQALGVTANNSSHGALISSTICPALREIQFYNKLEVAEEDIELCAKTLLDMLTSRREILKTFRTVLPPGVNVPPTQNDTQELVAALRNRNAIMIIGFEAVHYPFTQ